MNYVICYLIADDIVHKAEMKKIKDLWAEAHACWLRFEEFLRQLNIQDFAGKTIDRRLFNICVCPKSTLVFPDLADVGRIAFRSQVLPSHHLSSLPPKTR